MRITAIVFDMGDVFFDATPWRRALVAHLRARGIAIDYPEFCRRWEACLVEVYVGRREYWETFRGFLAGVGLCDETLDETIAFARRRAAEVEKRTLFDGVADTLARLKALGLRLAVLSDTESPEPSVRERLADLGIEQYFDIVVSSRDIGCAKPDPRAYAAALQRLGLAAAQCLFVGHDVEELTGAIRCGLGAVAFNAGTDAVGCRAIRSFPELLEVVR